MMNIGWRFPPLSGGTRQGYTNNDIEGFKGQELFDNLAREICQNSLDAHIGENCDPVKVIFELKEIEQSKYDVFSQYAECLEGCKNYWGEEMDKKLSRFISRAEDMLTRKYIPVLVASDYNTKGLNGSHSNDIKSPWEALTGSDGVSVKNDSNSAGSYGIGKNAPFAASALSMVFYNTLDEKAERAFIGVARVATLLNREGKATQRVGKYQKNDEENEAWKPIFENDPNSFRDYFPRNEQGTDVIIVGFAQEDKWETYITRAVLVNFFVAIHEKNLVVEVKNGDNVTVINSETLSQLISDFTEKFAAKDSDMLVTSQMYQAFITPECKKTTSIYENDDVEVYAKVDNSYKRYVANFRSTGMRLGRYQKRLFQHYAAVVVVRGKELGELLLETEPPRHNRWDYKQIEEPKDKRIKAKKAIEAIEAFVEACLKNQSEVNLENQIDAAGVGEYLPDEDTGTGERAKGDDLLKVKVKIGKVKNNSPKTGTITESAVKAKGEAQSGGVHNSEKNPDPPVVPPSVPVIPGNGKKGVQSGAAAGKGRKTITTPNLSAQRAFPINADQGFYRIVLVPKEDYENLYVECLAIGEDGKADALTMESFMYNGKSIKIVGGKAGPIKVSAGERVVFHVKFQRKEKMQLRLSVTEEAKQ